ncbi:MAG: NAD-dependent epimerase/dehydratase family protein [Gaiellaceae bacterium]
MKILVTGATGFIGSHLLPALTDAGHEVVALARDGRGLAGRDAIAVVEADLSRPLDRGTIPAVDAAIHLAQANVPFPDGARELFRVNLLSTQELLEAAREAGATRFLYTSSGSIYGLGEGAVAEDDPRRATDFYPATKQASEALVRAYAPFFGTTILRPFAPYGPGQNGRLIPGLIGRVRDGRPVTLNGGGRPRLTPIFVDDAVRVILAALETDGNHLVNLAGDEVVSIRDLGELIGEALDREPVFEDGGSGAGDLIGLNARMHELYSPGRLVPLRDGLRATVLAEAIA